MMAIAQACVESIPGYLGMGFDNPGGVVQCRATSSARMRLMMAIAQAYVESIPK